MKKIISAIIAFTLLSFPAYAISLSPVGADYGMGSRAYVNYNGVFYELQSSGNDRALQDTICEDSGWENKLYNEALNQSQISFINGFIYNSDYPDGVDSSGVFLTLDSYVYEFGRYVAFCEKYSRVLSPDYCNVFEDINANSRYSVLPGMGAAPEDSMYNYSDEPWYIHGLVATIQECFFTGYLQEDGSFRFMPENNITRAEVISTIMQCTFPKVQEYSGAYGDISQGDWYYPVISKAYEAGLLTAEENIYPNEPATREFVAQMLSNIALQRADVKDLEFNDADEISPSSLEGIKALYSLGAIQGYPDNTFRPQNNISRAEFSVMLGNLIINDQLLSQTPSAEYASEFCESYFDTYAKEDGGHINARLADFATQMLHQKGLPESISIPS